MRQFRQILRLKHEAGLSNRAIARACGVGVGTVSNYVRRAQEAGLSWPLPAELDDVALERMLFPPPPPRGTPRPQPDLAWIHQELRRPEVTLQLLWHEYLEDHPEGYRYTQLCAAEHSCVYAELGTMRSWVDSSRQVIVYRGGYGT
jgi:transposase